MVTPVDIGFVLAGAVLLFSGAALSIYGVGGMGLLLGGGGGFLVAPAVGGLLGLSGVAATGGAVLAGSLAGLIVTYALLSVAVAGVAMIVGTYVGLIVAEPLVGSGNPLITVPVAFAIGVGSGLSGTVLTRTTMVLMTSFLGAALASRKITVETLTTAQSELTLDPVVFDPQSPLFLGLFVLGILSQFGLFKLGYVTKIVGWLPGAVMLTDGSDD